MVLIRQPNADELAAYRVKYRRNRRVAWGATFAVIPVLTAALFVWSENLEMLAMAIIGCMLVAGLASTLFWKCPRCKMLFGSSWRVESCPGCGVRLDDAARRARATD